jgi:hypothetical protein
MPLFDGLVDVYSTCRDCGMLMKVIAAEDHSHPTCVIVQTEVESLADLWLAETTRGDDESAVLTEQLIEKVSILVDLQSAAMEYASWGWPVFPLAKHSKTPAIPKRKGGKGFKDATTDVDRIKRWWHRHPDHNIGIATGHAFDVLDIDTKDSDGNPSPLGVMSFQEMLHNKSFRHTVKCRAAQRTTCKCKPKEVHAVAVTASGGMHLYVKPTGKGSFAGIKPGVDYRGLGGYVVAPPSRLVGPGRGYTWLTEPSPILKGDT